MYFMLDSMIRYDQINATFQKWYSEDARNFESFVQTSDLLRVFRSVSLKTSLLIHDLKGILL